jgi:hypothetical protein
MRIALRTAIAVALVGIAAMAARAQEAVKPSDVAKFMGTWALNLDSPQGSFTLNFALTEKEGKIG